MINLGISSFNCLPHRLQPVASCGKIRFINDSKATNAVAAARALAAYDNIYWVAGGLAKKDGLEAAISHLGSVKKAYLIGAAAKSFAKSLTAYCPATTFVSLEEATRTAFDDAYNSPIGGTILLSPAAASFDQFQSFVARGDKFSALARDLCASEFRPREESHA